MTDIVERLRNGMVGGSMVVDAADEIERLRCELTIANNQLGNAEGALADAGTVACAGPGDVAAAIERLTDHRDIWKSIAAELHADLINQLPLSYEEQRRPAIQAYRHARNKRWKKARKWLRRCER